jgi:hypothetical protein
LLRGTHPRLRSHGRNTQRQESVFYCAWLCAAW